MNGFDRIAPVYDLLTKLVFGESMFKAQTAFLPTVREKNKVLILGGGTGWILAELLKNQPSCEVWYIDSSSRMIEMAKQKCNTNANVHFILGTQNSIPSIKFDVVIMNFFLDLFEENQAESIIINLKDATKQTGTWLITDFEDEGKWWQRGLLKAMLSFFRMVCSIEARVLPGIKSILTRNSLYEKNSLPFFHGFIKARIYHMNEKQIQSL